MRKIRVMEDEEIERAYRSDAGRWAHRLEIRLSGGDTIFETVEYPLGDYRNPFDWQTADRKFRTVTGGILPAERQERLLNQCRNLENLDQVSELFK